MLKSTATFCSRRWLTHYLFGLCLCIPVAHAGTPDIQATDAWVRWLPAGLPGAGYVTLTNNSSTEHVLRGASSPDYGDVGVHQSLTRNGVSEMVSVTSLLLKPGATLRFSEGGYHLMLLQSKRSLHPGDKVTILFVMDDGHSLSVPFDVRPGN